MKLKLGVNETPWTGYTNIDPNPANEPDKGWDVVVYDPRLIDELVDDAECTEIVAANMLDYIHVSQLIPFVSTLVRKLRHGGKLILGGTDLHTVVRSYILGDIKPEELVNILYGAQFGAWHNKVGMYPISEIISIMLELGLQITKKNLTNGKMSVEGVRL